MWAGRARPMGGVKLQAGKMGGAHYVGGASLKEREMRLLWPQKIGPQLPVRRFLCGLSTHHCAVACVGPQNEVGGLLCARRSSNEAESGRTYSVLIAGGGIMGCSSAFFLAQRIPPSSICVVERDSKVCESMP